MLAVPRSGFVATLLLILSTPALADVAGTWTGSWTKNGDALPVVVTFERSGDTLSGHFASDALQRGGIPFAEVRESGRHVHFVLKGDRSTIAFEGEERGGTLDGTLAENDARGNFHLERAKVAPPAPESREVSFNDGDVKLAGTLLLPPTKGRHPAVLFLHGSGAEGRFANRWLAEQFARAGFAALIYDKRGVGQSSGDWKDAGFGQLADDAVAGIRLLQSLPEVNAGRVGVYGHSQGGTIAPLVADRAGDLAFVIASAAGGIDPAEIEEYSIGNSIGVSSLPPSEAKDARAFVRTIVDVAYRGHPRAELDAAVAAFKRRSWYFDPPARENFYWSFSRRIADYRPGEYWRQVKAPVLLLYGEKDARVPPKPGSDAIIAALHAGGNVDVVLKMFPGVDHTFSLPVTNGGWPKRASNYADTMIEWAKSRSKPAI